MNAGRRATGPDARWADGPEAPPASSSARIRGIARALGVGIVAAAALVLAGWAFDVVALRDPIPDATGTSASVALGFLLAGLALWLLAFGGAGLQRRMGRLLGALAALVAAGSLIDHVLHADLGFELTLITPQSAAALLLLGLALAIPDAPVRRLTELLLLPAGAIGLFGLLAYLYGSGSFEGAEALAPPPPQTALGLLVLSAGVACARPDRGAVAALRGSDAGAIMARRLLPIAIVAMPVVGWLRIEGQHADLYDSDAGVALFVAVVVVMLIVGIRATGEILKRAEARDREHERRLQAIVDQTSAVVVLKDVEEGRYLLANNRFAEVVGRPREEIRGTTDEDLFPPELAETIKANDRQALESSRPAEFEETFPLADGPHTFVSARFPLLDANRTPYAICAVKTDITDRKRAEKAVGEARQEAERANLAKSEFLSRMSHELRTPLNSIIGFGQLLEMEGLDDRRREYAERILKGGRHLLELINEVLDISRIEAGSLGISLEPVDADAALADALGLVRPIAGDRGLRIDPPSPAARPRYVAADQQRLRQILLNLLSNAVKYNRPGGEIVARLDERGDRLAISVADTGSGLTPPQLGRLFVTFERLGAEAGDVEGTGLGLALSKRLAEAMRGTLEVESEPGVGTTFTLELERAVGPSSAERPKTAAAESIGPGAEARSEMLYIEDNLSNLRLVEEILSHRPGVELLAAMHGSLGLELAAQHRPELIVLDLHLPDLSGSQVLARLRSDPGTSEIPVVVLSADATPGRIDELLAAGAIDFLTKPLDVRRFLELIDEHLGSGGSAHVGSDGRDAWMQPS